MLMPILDGAKAPLPFAPQALFPFAGRFSDQWYRNKGVWHMTYTVFPELSKSLA